MPNHVGIVSIEMIGVSHDQLKDAVEFMAEQLDQCHRNGMLLAGMEDNFGKGIQVVHIHASVRTELP